MSSKKPIKITGEMLETAYRQGAFPMAKNSNKNSEIQWFIPNIRALILPQKLHISRRLKQILRQTNHTFVWDDSIPKTIIACGENRPEGTWINLALIDAYTQWGRVYALGCYQGFDHAGGIYGVHCGGIFMAESMFSRQSNASSLALAVLVAGLAKAGVTVIDVQFNNPHIARFGVTEIPHADYMTLLDSLWNKPVVLKPDYFTVDVALEFIQSLSQTS